MSLLLFCSQFCSWIFNIMLNMVHEHSAVDRQNWATSLLAKIFEEFRSAWKKVYGSNKFPRALPHMY